MNWIVRNQGDHESVVGRIVRNDRGGSERSRNDRERFLQPFVRKVCAVMRGARNGMLLVIVM
jgi:hypothetical protein